MNTGTEKEVSPLTGRVQVLLPEILSQLRLSQFDKLNLIQVNSYFYNVFVPTLYDSITIDAKFSRLDPEFNTLDTTYIKTKSNLQSFFHTLYTDKDKHQNTDDGITKSDYKCLNLSNPIKLTLIKSLFCFDFPVEYIEFGKVFKDLLPYMTQLKTLQAESYPMGFNIVEILKSNKLLTDLRLLFNVYDKSYLSNNFQKRTILNSINSNKTQDDLEFSNLETLSLNNFIDSINLDTLLQNLLNHNFALKNLKLVKLKKLIRLQDLINNDSDNYEFNTIEILFKQLVKNNLINLNKLHLENILIDNKTINYFKLLNFKNLNYLNLDNITEFQINNISFLDNFNNLDNLKKLSLNIRSNNELSILKFLENNIKDNSLTELSLNLRFNFLQQNISFDKQIDDYINFILRQKLSLVKLAFEIREENYLSGLIDQLYSMNEDQFYKLIIKDSLDNDNVFPLLKSLKINTNAHFFGKYRYKILINNFKNLEYLWIFGLNSYEQHWGLGNVYPGIFDEWLRIMYIPEGIVSDISKTDINYNKLKYIKIFKFIFEIKWCIDKSPQVNPRNLIDNWFDNKCNVNDI